MALPIHFLDGHQPAPDYASACVWVVEAASAMVAERQGRHHAGLIAAAYLERPEIRLAAGEDGELCVADAPELGIRLSTAGKWVAVALAPAGRVGVHVERMAWEMGPGTLAESYFSARELGHIREAPAERQRSEFYRFWTAKCAVTQAAGGGMGLEAVEIERRGERYVVARVGGVAVAAERWRVGHRVLKGETEAMVAGALGDR